MFTNSLGFRDHAVRDIPLKSERRRTLIIGDSFGEGLGVPYEQAFASLIETALAGTNREVLKSSSAYRKSSVGSGRSPRARFAPREARRSR